MTALPKDPDISPELLKEYLHEEDMTPGQLASYLHVAETTVQRWLKGEARPTGTAKAILWTLIGLGGMALGAAAPLVGPAAGLTSGASLGLRLLRGASIGISAIASGVGIYRLLRNKLEKVGIQDVEAAVELLRQKEEQEAKVRELRERLAEEEQKLKELEDLASTGASSEK